MNKTKLQNTNISLDFTSFAEQIQKGICLQLALKENCLKQQFVIFIFINIITTEPQYKKPTLKIRQFHSTFQVLYKSQLHSQVGTGRTVCSLIKSDC